MAQKKNNIKEIHRIGYNMIKETIENKELELSVLGAMFINQDTAVKICSSCKDTDFSNINLRKVFLGAKKLIDKGDKINNISLWNALNRKYAIEIADIMGYSITDVFVDQHIRELKEIATKRRLQKVDYSDIEQVKAVITELERENTIVEDNAILSIDDLTGNILIYYEKGADPGKSTGWTALDEYYNISLGQITIVTGIPGAGKSEFIDSLMINLSELHNWRIAYFSPENFPIERHIRKIIEKKTGFPFFEGVNPRLSKTELEYCINEIREYFYFLNPRPENRNINFILSQVRQLVINKNINCFVLDPWNELESERPETMRETEYISNCLMKIKAFAVFHNIHIWIIAHPTKLSKDSKGDYPVPTPYDIYGSSNWRYKADNCIAVHRPVWDSLLTEIYIQKIRFRDNGKIGKVNFSFNIINSQYKEMT